jgi:hypothetical protein
MSILETMRLVQACCQPITGERATGAIVLKSATAGNVAVPRGRYLFPMVNGKVDHSRAFKTMASNAQGDPWSVTPAGTAVAIHSNIGGARHNLPAGTRFVIDQPLRPDLVAQPILQTPTVGGDDPVGDLALFNFVSFDYFGSQPSLELFQSAIGGRFPAAIMFWEESEPSDGQTTSAVTRPTHRGAGNASYSELFEILVVSSRADSEHERRAQALRILDELTALLIDRQAVDGVGMSSPGGIHIRGRYRVPGETQFYKAFQVYGLRISVQVTYVKRDLREYAELRRFRIDAPREDHPAADLPLVVNNLVDNPQT